LVQSENIRNFSIIAHIDHGKSTLADRFLEHAGLLINIQEGQVLDTLSLEKERGITIRSHPVTLLIKNKIRASVHHVIMKKNIDDVPFFISAMDKVGVKRINFSSLVPIGPGAKEQSISPEESKRITEWMIEFQKDVKVSIVGQRPTWALVGSEGFCPVGYKTLTLYADGKFMPCRRLPIIIGDARTDTFFKVWFTSEFLKKNERKRKIC